MSLKKTLKITLRLMLLKLCAIALWSIILVGMPSINKNMASTGIGQWKLTATDGRPDYAGINRYIDQYDTEVPKDIIKAVAWVESGWQHQDIFGEPVMGINRKTERKGKKRINSYSFDWGLMQINDTSGCLASCNWDMEKIKRDPVYNINAGIAVLETKKEYIDYLKNKRNWRRLARRYRLNGKDDDELLIKAYNGFQPSWKYVELVKEAIRQRPWEMKMATQIGTNDYPVELSWIPMDTPADIIRPCLNIKQDFKTTSLILIKVNREQQQYFINRNRL